MYYTYPVLFLCQFSLLWPSVWWSGASGGSSRRNDPRTRRRGRTAKIRLIIEISSSALYVTFNLRVYNIVLYISAEDEINFSFNFDKSVRSRTYKAVVFSVTMNFEN